MFFTFFKLYKCYQIAQRTTYFLVHGNGYIRTLKTENFLNIYITEIFGEILKKGNVPAFFDTLLTVRDIRDRETIYNRMKDNVINYGLKPFYADYEHVDDFYYAIQVNNAGSTEPPARTILLYKLIRDGNVAVTRTLI